MAKKKAAKKRSVTARYCTKAGCSGRPKGQEKICPQCGKNKPAGGWAKEKGGSSPATPAAASGTGKARSALSGGDVVRITLEVSQRLAKGGITLDELKVAKPLTVGDILRHPDCSESIKKAASDGEIARKIGRAHV